MIRYIHYTDNLPEFVDTISRLEEVLIVHEYERPLIAKVCGYKALTATTNYEAELPVLLNLFDYNQPWTILYLWDHFCRNEAVRIENIKLEPIDINLFYEDKLCAI